MSRIPNFANIAFENIARAAPTGGAEPWLTPEGIPVKPGYSEADLEGIDFLETWPGIAPYLRGLSSTQRSVADTSIAGALRVAGRLPAPASNVLTAGSKGAFVSGLHLAALCAVWRPATPLATSS